MCVCVRLRVRVCGGVCEFFCVCVGAESMFFCLAVSPVFGCFFCACRVRSWPVRQPACVFVCLWVWMSVCVSVCVSAGLCARLALRVCVRVAVGLVWLPACLVCVSVCPCLSHPLTKNSASQASGSILSMERIAGI